MVLIEGLGDEVTLVLGSFLIMVILLLAWFSTHTEDIPLIREIVVELRMRNRSQTNVINEQPPQEVEIPQSSREGVPPDSDHQENNCSRNPNALLTELMREEGDDASDDSAVSNSEASPASSSSSETSESPSVAVSVSSSQNRDSPSESCSASYQRMRESQSTLAGVGAESQQTPSVQEEGDEIPDGASAIVSHHLIDSPVLASVTAASQIEGETKEETLRRRRVQYFQSGAHALPCDSVGSDNNHGKTDLSNSKTISQHSNKQTLSSEGDCDIQETVSALGGQFQRLQVDDHPVPMPQQAEPSDQGAAPSGDSSTNSQIRVKLKYLNETQRFVYASPADTIGDFRRTHFQSELQDNKWVRFIFNGQDLRDDASTLQACNIENNCTMHCLVTSRNRSGDRGAERPVVEEDEESMFGSLMYPLFTLILMIIWYFRIFYRQYFSAMSTVCLIGISFLLALSYLSSFRTSDTATPMAAQGRTAPPPPANGRRNHPHSD